MWAAEILLCLTFSKLSWIWKNLIHIADISYDNTKAQMSCSLILRVLLPTGFPVPHTITVIRAHLPKFWYAFYIHWKVNCQFTDKLQLFPLSGRLLKYTEARTYSSRILYVFIIMLLFSTARQTSFSSILLLTTCLTYYLHTHNSYSPFLKCKIKTNRTTHRKTIIYFPFMFSRGILK